MGMELANYHNSIGGKKNRFRLLTAFADGIIMLLTVVAVLSGIGGVAAILIFLVLPT